MNASERKGLNMGLSFSARLIVAIFITTFFHLFLHIPQTEAIILALIVAFFPKFLYRTASKILKFGGNVGGKVAVGGMKATGSALDAGLKGIQGLMNKKK